jgi:hypothetical protein
MIGRSSWCAPEFNSLKILFSSLVVVVVGGGGGGGSRGDCMLAAGMDVGERLAEQIGELHPGGKRSCHPMHYFIEGNRDEKQIAD